MKEIIESVADIIKLDIKLIYMALYIDTVEKILYFISIGASKDIIDYNLKICDQAVMYID